MSVPGSNLLRQALKMIKPQTVIYYQDIGRVTNAVGKDVTTFAPGVAVPNGSVQAVPLERYEQLGLDRQHYYVAWFVDKVNVTGIARGRSGDQFAWGNNRYQIVGQVDWWQVDGWSAIIGIRIGNEATT